MYRRQFRGTAYGFKTLGRELESLVKARLGNYTKIPIVTTDARGRCNK